MMMLDYRFWSRKALLLALSSAFALGTVACGEATTEDCTGAACGDQTGGGGKGDIAGGGGSGQGQQGSFAGFAETIAADGDVGRYSALVVDSQERRHVTYYDEIQGDLKYVSGNDFGWTQPVSLDSEGDVGRASSIALGPNGTLHVTYYDATNDQLKYIRFDGQGWDQPYAPIEVKGTGEYSVVVADAKGQVHVAYSDRVTYNNYGSTDIDYIRFDGVSWSEPQALYGLGEARNREPGMVVDDATGRVHVVVADELGSKEMWHLYSDGGEWSEPTVFDSGSEDGWGDAALAIDAAGNLHVAYWAREYWSEKGIKYARFDGAKWSEPVSLFEGSNDGFGVAIETYQNRVYVAYQEPKDNGLAVSVFDGQAWSAPIVVDGGGEQEVGSDLSLDIDSVGFLHISYYDETNRDLKYYQGVY